MTDLYRSNARYTRNDIVQNPGEVPMVEVRNAGNMVVAILHPEDFDQQYSLVPDEG